uniref:C2H2-type domain-containing protein n=1 Tax=Eptatretus burgeri TaxID=7764 RepID=A0A8C4N6N4_EPTBU
MYVELCRYMESCRAGRASGRTGDEGQGLAAVLRKKVEDSDSVDRQEEGRDPETGDGRQRKLVRTFHCTSCSCSFTTKAALKMHTNSHQPVSPNKKHKCSHCSFRTDHKGNLMNHAHDCSAVKLYTCGVCGERFSESQNVQKHMQVHTTERPYKCKVCKNTFSKLSNLKRHTLIHTTNKPFICGVCGKGFRSSSYCHMQDSHGRAPVHTCTM